MRAPATLALRACLLACLSASSAMAQVGEPQSEPAPEAEEPDVVPATRISCLDDASPEGDPRKGVQRRPFLKRMRVEVSGVGGLNASDVLSSTYVYGGAVSFYPSEDFGIEALVTRAPVNYRLEAPFTSFDREQRFIDTTAWQAIGSLLYAPFHAKLKLSETNIVAGDVFVIAGAGRTFSDTVQGITWEVGLGMKVYAWNRVSFRIDLRDFILPQEVLGQARVTHNLSVLGGLSLWLL